MRNKVSKVNALISVVSLFVLCSCQSRKIAPTIIDLDTFYREANNVECKPYSKCSFDYSGSNYLNHYLGNSFSYHGESSFSNDELIWNYSYLNYNLQYSSDGDLVKSYTEGIMVEKTGSEENISSEEMNNTFYPTLSALLFTGLKEFLLNESSLITYIESDEVSFVYSFFKDPLSVSLNCQYVVGLKTTSSSSIGVTRSLGHDVNSFEEAKNFVFDDGYKLELYCRWEQRIEFDSKGNITSFYSCDDFAYASFDTFSDWSLQTHEIQFSSTYSY